MRRKYNKRSRGIRRRKSLKSTNAGPILALTGVIAGVLALLALIVFVAVPYLLPLLGLDVQLPWQPTPTPVPTPRPTPTPHPVSQAASNINPQQLQTEVVLSGFSGYQWYADPFAYENSLYFAGGRLEEGDVRMDALFSFHMDTQQGEKLDATLSNYSYAYPRCNEKWLVYFDGKKNGGGYIRALNRQTGQNRIVKEVYVETPRLHLDGDFLAWMERTGSRMDKLFVADLNTLENVTVKTFNGSAYGQSNISLKSGELLFAADGTGEIMPNGQEASDIYSLKITEGGVAKSRPIDTYVHDPLSNSIDWLWRDGLHSERDVLYWSRGGAAAQRIAENVVDYGLSASFAAYSSAERLYLYVFTDKKTIPITPEGERVQLMGVSDGVVIWMDVTTRDREVMKYAKFE